jgi:hypothetical protein
VAPPGLKDPSRVSLKRKVSHSKSHVMCRWDGKEAVCEARGLGFES